MNPENTTDSTEPESPEYLNEIAPKSKKAGFDLIFKKPLLLVGLVLVVVIIFIILAMFASNLTSGGTNSFKTLSARLSTTANTVKLSNKNIQNTKLRALNSSLSIYLTNTSRDFTPILAINKIDTKKLDKKLLAAESNTKTLANLEEARLNAIYDRVYVVEMSTQLDKILTLMEQINKSTKSAETKTFLGNSIKNLEPIQKQFADYNSPVS